MTKTKSSHLVALACLGLGFGCSDSKGGANDASGGAGTSSMAGSSGVSGTTGSSGTGGGGASGEAGQAGGGESTAGGNAGTGGTAAGAGGDSGGGGGVGGDAGSGGFGGLAATGCPAPNATLCWDFEEGTIPTGWTASRDEFNGSLVVDGTNPHRGNFALHAKDLVGGVVAVPAVQGGPKKSIKLNLPANFGPVMWGRAYIFTTPEAPVSHAGFFNARYQQPGSNDTDMSALDWYEIATYQGTYMSIWHTPEPPGYPEWVKTSDTPVVIGDWACVEWEFDGANGAEAGPADPRVWLTLPGGGATELTWPSEFTFDNSGTDSPLRPPQQKAENFTMIETGIVMYQGLEVPTNWWIDDLAIGPQRIGCN